MGRAGEGPWGSLPFFVGRAMNEDQAADLLAAVEAVRFWVEFGLGVFVAYVAVKWIGLESYFKVPK